VRIALKTIGKLALVLGIVSAMACDREVPATAPAVDPPPTTTEVSAAPRFDFSAALSDARERVLADVDGDAAKALRSDLAALENALAKGDAAMTHRLLERAHSRVRQIDGAPADIESIQLTLTAIEEGIQ
jgi:hypothetical protein